ncbi:DNA double-strand break repair protein Mre11 [Candidatus Anstonella stagnisolia]|nr:DNA double-strand break repair protein Mre11 [Candidatus Anstonella stagnisolia]
MIIGIVSDTHFGFSRFENDAYEQGRQAILEAAKQCDLLLLPGDIFDIRIAKPETIAQVAGILLEAGKILGEKECAKHSGSRSIVPIIAIHGTHERRPHELVNPIQLMESAGLLADVHNSTLLFEKNKEKIAISGIGGVPDDLAKTALESMKCAPSSSAFNIFMLHQSFSEMIPSGEEMLSLDDLPQGFDLYICGHLHKRAFLKNDTILIPGSTVITQLREEEQEEKGYVLYDTAEKRAKFVPIDSRPFFFREIKLENANAQAAKEAIEDEISRANSSAGGKAPLIKIKVSGTLANGLSPADVRIGAFGENIFIETAFSAPDLKEKLQSIRSKHEEKLSAAEYGMKMLRDKLVEAKIEHLSDEETFLLLQENPEEFVKRIKEKKIAVT